jgi:uncharacterized protein YjbI with pentapeptide repeats
VTSAALIFLLASDAAFKLIWTEDRFACLNEAGENGLNRVAVEEITAGVSGECADLRNAVLVRLFADKANFKGARLDGAELRGAEVAQAVFDQHTLLPFAKTEALARGMIFQEARTALPAEDLRSF